MDTFVCKDGRVVELEFDEDVMTVWTTGNRQKVGAIAFAYIEGPSDTDVDDYYLVTNLDLGDPNSEQSFIGQGIGREIIRRVGEHTPVAFTPFDGNRRSDGSHLTGMGPEFARRMVSEGLAFWDELTEDFSGDE